MFFPALLLLSAAAGAAACIRPPAEDEVGVQSETTEAGLELPQTPAGVAARGFFGAFNSDDPERIRAFVQEFAGPAPDRSLNERVQGYRSAYEQVGFLRPLSIDPSTDTELVVRARSALEGELYLIFIVDRQPPHHLGGIYFERAGR
jgi:hypothetical protein